MMLAASEASIDCEELLLGLSLDSECIGLVVVSVVSVGKAVVGRGDSKSQRGPYQPRLHVQVAGPVQLPFRQPFKLEGDKCLGSSKMSDKWIRSSQSYKYKYLVPCSYHFRCSLKR
jgi:hypothetical protein